MLLEEIGRPSETEKVAVSGGARHKPPFLAINSKDEVPTLVRDDGPSGASRDDAADRESVI